MNALRTLFALSQDVLTPPAGTTAILHQRHVQFTRLPTVAEQHTTPITSLKEVISTSFRSRIAAPVEKQLMTQVLLRYRAQLTMFALIWQVKMELLRSWIIVKR